MIAKSTVNQELDVPDTAAFEIISQQLADPNAQWSLGTFGAIAEFMRDPDETAEFTRADRTISVVTPRGAILLESREGLRPIAFETITTQAWSQRVAFCLPEAESAMSRRTVLTELGPDTQALRVQDRDAILFDLGLGVLQVDCCVRAPDPAVAATLREHTGRSLFDHGNPAMGLILRHSPHRVFVTRCGRAEVYQGIPLPGGKAPEGPHTHVLPKLLAHGRTHAATEPIPAGWVSCAHLYPAHPLRDGYGRALPFEPGRHAAFQHLLQRHGDPGHIRLKDSVVAALGDGVGPSVVDVAGGRFARAAVRIALRQARALDMPAPSIAAWVAAYDAQKLAEDEPDEAA